MLQAHRVAATDSCAGHLCWVDPMPALLGYRGPMLAVVTPEADTPNEIRRLVPRVQHDVMDGTSHWIQLDKPEGFNRILDRFLEQIEESR